MKFLINHQQLLKHGIIIIMWACTSCGLDHWFSALQLYTHEHEGGGGGGGGTCEMRLLNMACAQLA